jgi:hypothetical protein
MINGEQMEAEVRAAAERLKAVELTEAEWFFVTCALQASRYRKDAGFVPAMHLETALTVIREVNKFQGQMNKLIEERE